MNTNYLILKKRIAVVFHMGIYSFHGDNKTQADQYKVHVYQILFERLLTIFIAMKRLD